jgi:hypothetical protein
MGMKAIVQNDEGQKPAARDCDSESECNQASKHARRGEPLPADSEQDDQVRSPKQENL